MTALAQKLDERFQQLDADTLEQVESVILTVLDALEKASKNHSKSPEAKPYQSSPRALGLKAGLSYDNVAELIAASEGEGWK